MNPKYRPIRLGVFVINPESGHPLPNLPLYAEIAVPKIITPRPPETRFSFELFLENHATGMVTMLPEPTVPEENLQELIRKIEAAFQAAFGEVLDNTSRDILLSDQQKLLTLYQKIMEYVLGKTQRPFNQVSSDEYKKLIQEALRHLANEFQLTLLPDIQESTDLWANPLGVLATDHVGYASFDLERLSPEVLQRLVAAIDARRTNAVEQAPLSIWIQPYGHAQRFDVMEQARFTSDAIVARLNVLASVLPPSLKNMGAGALQNPSLTDWRLSPSSFAASPKALVGEDGCEELVPANLALQEFVLRQVVRISKSPLPEGTILISPYENAYVDEYKVSWHSLGHSLGEILYSLPLAPGESVKLAVIDWSWDSLTKRDENTQLSEAILHQTHSDRTITETVKAGLKELQHGSSFMGGAAGSSGATGGANLGFVGLGAAVGNTWSLGGSTATSDGSRDLVAENVQRLI